MPVESRHFLLNAQVAGRVLVLRQIAKSLVDGVHFTWTKVGNS